MKKLVVAIVVALVVIVGAGPWYMGRVAHSRVDKGLDSLVEKVPYIRIAERKWSAGWFRSESLVTFEFVLPNDVMRLQYRGIPDEKVHDRTATLQQLPDEALADEPRRAGDEIFHRLSPPKYVRMRRPLRIAHDAGRRAARYGRNRATRMRSMIASPAHVVQVADNPRAPALVCRL